MVFEPNFTKVVSSVRKNIGITQSVIELKLPTNEESVSRVYSVGAKASIITSERVGRDINYSGLVDFQAMFEGNEGVSAVDYTAEFRDKYEGDSEGTGELVFGCNVVDVSSSVVSDGIRVVAIVETTIDEIVTNEINVLTGASGDDVHTSTRELVYSEYMGRAYEKFDVSGDMQISGVEGVLMVTPSVCVGNIEPNDNYLVVNGKLNLDICYKSGPEKQDIRTMYYAIDFSWEVALEGLNAGSIVQSVISVLTNEIKVSTLLEDGMATLSFYAPVVYSGYVFNERKLEVVDDIYLENNYMSITCENFETVVGSTPVNFKDNISGTASILETSPFIDEILGVATNNLVLASSRVEDGRLYIEGVVNSTVIYYTKETNDITSVVVEMPFAVEEKVEGQNSSVVTICLENVSARSKRGKEIEVSAELNVYADMYDENSLTAITGVSEGEEKKKDDCSLFIYVVRPNQSMWDIAKDIGVSQELLMEQNPDVALPLVGGEKLVVYQQTMCKF